MLGVDRLQVEPQVDQHFLGDNRRQEAVQRLLGAAVGVVGEIGQGVDQRAGQGGRVPHLEPRLIGLPLGGDAEDHLRRLLVGPDRASEGLGLEHAVDIGRERHLCRVRFLVGQGLHADDRLAFVDHFHPPVDPVLRAGVDLHGPRGLLHRLEHAALELQHDLDGLLRLELVMDVGREHDLIFLDEEPGCLEPDEQVLGRDDLGLALADLRAQAHRPALDPPGRQALGQREIDLGGAFRAGVQRGGPEGGVGEVGSDNGRDGRRRALTIGVGGDDSRETHRPPSAPRAWPSGPPPWPWPCRRPSLRPFEP